MRIILAPMEGVVDAFVRDYLTDIGGIDQCVTEFVRVSQGVLPPSVFKRLAPELDNQCLTSAGIPVVVQLLGSDPQLLAENAMRAVELGAKSIDLNFGCPAKTVNKSRGGAVLLDEPELIGEIVAAVRAILPPEIPVTGKMRLGNRDKSLALDNALAMAQSGASEIVVHARTKMEGYRPPAHWEWISRIREAVKINVVANGDINSLADYHACREVSGCQDVMIGRGLIANPFLGLSIKQGLDLPHEESWQKVLRVLHRYQFELAQTVEDRYVAGRLKQWTKMLAGHFEAANELFDKMRVLKTVPEIDQLLLDAQIKEAAI